MRCKGISLVGFDDVENVKRIQKLFPEARFELSYAMNDEFLEAVKPVLKGKVASVHSLCPRREFFPNFASSDEYVATWSTEEMLKDASTAADFGASILVLHPGYLVPSLVPTDTRKRLALMGCGILNDYIGVKEGSICRPDYIVSKAYRDAFELMIPQLESLSQNLKRKGVTLAVENLNPRAGYMLIHPDEILELAERTSLHFTLDIGHLWITTELYELDFLDSVERILSTGRVVTTHLHANPSDRKKQNFQDSHQSLDGFNMPYKEALKMIEESGANMMLETKELPEHNLSILFS